MIEKWMSNCGKALRLVKDARTLAVFRILLGVIFIASAILKLPHQAEFVQIVSSYEILPYSLAEVYGLLLPWVELTVGCLLILGLFTRFTAAISLAMVASFIVANSFAMSNPGAGTDNLCGCFGAAMPLNHAQSLGIDVVMMVMSLVLVLRPSYFMSLKLSLDKAIIARYASLVLVIVMFATMAAPPPTQAAATASTIYDDVIPASEDMVVDNPEEVRPVLRFFYSDLCHYCQEQKPVINEIEEEYADRITFIHINTGEDRDAVTKWSITTVPTMILSESTAPDIEYSRFEGRTEKEILQSRMRIISMHL